MKNHSIGRRVTVRAIAMVGYQGLVYDACRLIDGRLGGTTTIDTFIPRLLEAL